MNKVIRNYRLSVLGIFINIIILIINLSTPVYGEEVKLETEKPTVEIIDVVSDNTSIGIMKQKHEENQKIIEDMLVKQQEKIDRQQVKSSRNLSYYDITEYTDLSAMRTITADQMNEIIDYWNSRNSLHSPFTGNGQAFINASKESGLDPVYILAHAAIESAWGTSYYATNYHNYFGIGAFDSNPDNAVNYGNDSMENGLINGATWIANNYYNQGQTSLYTMRYNNGNHEYCTSTTWVDSITNIIQTSYSLIEY